MFTKKKEEYFDQTFWESEEYIDDEEAEEYYNSHLTMSPTDEDEFQKRRGAFLVHLDMAKFYQKKGYKTILDVLRRGSKAP